MSAIGHDVVNVPGTIVTYTCPVGHTYRHEAIYRARRDRHFCDDHRGLRKRTCRIGKHEWWEMPNAYTGRRSHSCPDHRELCYVCGIRPARKSVADRRHSDDDMCVEDFRLYKREYQRTPAGRAAITRWEAKHGVFRKRRGPRAWAKVPPALVHRMRIDRSRGKLVRDIAQRFRLSQNCVYVLTGPMTRR